jgi:hypothetical protein
MAQSPVMEKGQRFLNLLVIVPKLLEHISNLKKSTFSLPNVYLKEKLVREKRKDFS